MNFSQRYLTETIEILNAIATEEIEQLANELAACRSRGGRLFILGVGGSAAHASHAVNDFRKICGFEAYSPVDNVSELTARTNDEGWDTTFEAWLKGSRITASDAILVLSVGGGDANKNVSRNIVNAVALAKSIGASVLGILGRDGGYTKANATACVVVPPLHSDRVTPHTEELAAVMWHLLVSHPALKLTATKWESVV